MDTSVLPTGENWPSPNVLKAVEFIIKSHGNQTRKDGSPYWTHPFRVWRSICSVLDIQDDVVECSCLCHDIVEDTDQTLDDIATHFGSTVSMIVRDLTNDKKLPKREQKNRMIIKSMDIDNRARIIKCFDRIDNLADCLTTFTPDGIWHYTKEAILLHRNLRDGISDDEWADKARKAADLLEKAIDNVARHCHNSKYQKPSI